MVPRPRKPHLQVGPVVIPYGTEYDEDGFTAEDRLLEGIFSGAWLDQQTFPELEEIVTGILVEGFALIVGPPKVGKSWLVGNLALACAQGGRALGRIDVRQRPVLYLALEDGPRRLQSRLRKLNDDQPLPDALDMICTVEPGMIEATISAWMERHQDKAPLVILDTLGKARPQRRAGDDPYLADYKVGSQLKAIVDSIPGACLLVVHHTNKSESGDFVDAVSGTQGIAGSADSILVLRRPRKSNEATLAITGRDVTEREIALLTDNGKWELDGFTIESAEQVVETRKEKGHQGDQSLEILGYAKQHPIVTPKLVAAHFKIDPKTAGTYLGRLVDREHLFRIAYGKYSHQPPESPTGSTPIPLEVAQ
ncbi:MULTISPECIES: AAA family ATPase [Gordonia]|nr:AAA family ATPase [Gordonia sp. UBA5067]